MSNHKTLNLTLSLLVFILVANLGHTQTQTGGIVGNVTDAEANAIPGVTVTATSPALIQGSVTTQTGNDGYYRFVGLPPGEYSLDFTIQGFRSLVREGITVRVGSTIRLSLKTNSANHSQFHLH